MGALFNGLKALSAPLIRFILTRGISRRSFMALAADLASGAAITATVDEAAEYSDWVKENEGAIILIASVSCLGAGALIKGRTSFAGFKPKIFSKANLSAVASRAKRYASEVRVKATSVGCDVLLPNGQSIKLFKEAGKLRVAGSEKIVTMLTAIGFGGSLAACDSSQDWSDVGRQIGAAAASISCDEAVSVIEDECQKIGAAAVLTSGPLLLRQFSSEHTCLSTDTIASIMMRTLDDTVARVEDIWVDGFIDQQGDFVLDINGVHFAMEKESKILSFYPCPSRSRKSEAITQEQEEFALAACLAIAGVDDNHIELTKDPLTDLWYSYPACAGNVACCVVWAEKTSRMSLRFARTEDTLLGQDKTALNVLTGELPKTGDRASFVDKIDDAYAGFQHKLETDHPWIGKADDYLQNHMNQLHDSLWHAFGFSTKAYDDEHQVTQHQGTVTEVAAKKALLDTIKDQHGSTIN